MSENKQTVEDLKIMQAWSLQRKIQVAQLRIMEWYERFNGKIAVNFSGGVDSVVLLDLARRCYPDIPAVFVNTTIEYPELVDFVQTHKNVTEIRPQFCKVCTNCEEGCFAKIVKVHGWNYPNKNVATAVKYARKGSKWAIDAFNGVRSDGTQSTFRQSRFSKWKFLVDSPYKISDSCCKILKESVLDKWHKETGTVPIIGVLASESRRRRDAWLKTGCNAFDSKKQVSKPLSFWRQTDVLEYISTFDIPYCSAIYGDIIKGKDDKYRTALASQTGCSLCPTSCHLDKINKYQRMKETHPELWDYGINTLGLGEFLDFVGVDYGG